MQSINIGSTNFVNFTILLEKPICSLYFSAQKHPQLQCLATGIMFLQLQITLVVKICCITYVSL